MRFQVPQFIEQEAKIAGPLTFKQFLTFGIALFAIVILFTSLGKKSFFLFILASSAVLFSASAFAFLKINGKSLLVVLGNFFAFFSSAKIYLWKKKELPPKIIWKKTDSQSQIVKPKALNPDLRIGGQSRLKQIATSIDTSK